MYLDSLGVYVFTLFFGGFPKQYIIRSLVKTGHHLARRSTKDWEKCSSIGTGVPGRIQPVKTDGFPWTLTIRRSSGWWFGTFFIFHNIWDNLFHWLIFFRGAETTNQSFVGDITIFLLLNPTRFFCYSWNPINPLLRNKSQRVDQFFPVWSSPSSHDCPMFFPMFSHDVPSSPCAFLQERSEKSSTATTVVCTCGCTFCFACKHLTGHEPAPRWNPKWGWHGVWCASPCGRPYSTPYTISNICYIIYNIYIYILIIYYKSHISLHSDFI